MNTGFQTQPSENAGTENMTFPNPSEGREKDREIRVV
jgi:hypothetical protein